jgi:LmbE family N-acetylglucosaminyl deacetylase
LSADRRSFAFISLLRDEVEARGLARMLESLARSDAHVSSAFLVPEVRGLDFFAATDRQPSVDRWWSDQVPRAAVPVYLLSHEEGLAAWLCSIDGVFLVAAPVHTATGYPEGIVVDADLEDAPLALAEAVITRFGYSGGAAGQIGTDIFDRRDARTVARVRAGAAQPAASSGDSSPLLSSRSPGPMSAGTVLHGPPAFPPLLDVQTEVDVTAGSRSGLGADPFDLLAADSARADPHAAGWERQGDERPHPRAVSGRRPPLLRLPTGRRHGTTTLETALAAILVSRAPMLVVIGSRKGGVGKTSHAAGIAIAAGAVLDSVGHRAAIVDANIANPDAWGQLNLPAQAATVRDVVTALTQGVEPPLPINAATPALACYPERREGVEYSRTDIRRLATYLRARHAFTVVDMSNRLPDPTSGPEAAVAAFWLEEADALVLPTATSRQDFNGVLDYLDVPDLPPTVVPYIVSSTRRNRRHLMTRQYLDAIRARVDCLIGIPDEAENVRRAGMDGVPVEDVSPRMRVAYRRLTEAVSRLPARVRS